MKLNRAPKTTSQKIAALGGMLRAIEIGYVQGEIQKAAYEYQRAIERREQIVVGVNQFVAEKEISVPTLRIDPEIERAQVEAPPSRCAHAAIQGRPAAAVAAVGGPRANSETCCRLSQPLWKPTHSRRRISDALRRVFGEYTDRLFCRFCNQHLQLGISLTMGNGVL